MSSSVHAFSRTSFQNFHHRKHCVPIARRRWSAEQFIQLAEVANRFHLPAVRSKNKTALRRDNPHEPLTAWRNADGTPNPASVCFRENADESNHVRSRGLSSKWIVSRQSQDLMAPAEDNFRLEGQLSYQFCTEPCSRSGSANYKRAGRANIHDIVVAQLCGEPAWTK